MLEMIALEESETEVDLRALTDFSISMMCLAWKYTHEIKLWKKIETDWYPSSTKWKILTIYMVGNIIAVDSYTYKRGINFVGGVSKKALQRSRHLRRIEI